MPYFSYHGRNKRLIKEGQLIDYFYNTLGTSKRLILVFKDGRQFPVKEERWIEYSKIIDSYYRKEGNNEKDF